MDYQYFALTIQYFCLARIGAKYPFNPASGNLYHLSFELLLKSYLVAYISCKDLKNKYNHNLRKLWTEFKLKISNSALDRYDVYIKNLDVWERVRYITISDGSNASSIVIRSGHAPQEYLNEIAKIHNHSQKDFSLYLDDMDELFQAIIFATKIDTHALMTNQFDIIQGVKDYEKDNRYSIFK